MTQQPKPTPDSIRAPSRSRLRAGLEPSVIRRAIGYAIIVGPILIGINHGDEILSGDVSPTSMVKMGLTVIVPYLVSTCSSVSALRRLEEKSRATGGLG